MKKVLVTGAIGFIGFHLTKRLLSEGYEVVGIDNINSYYDVRLKNAKLPILGIYEDVIRPNSLYRSVMDERFRFAKMDIKDRYQIEELFRNEKFDIVVNLAAQAGVQYSLQNPHTYIENNIAGFINVIDAAKANNVKHFVYASSSSVYGNRDDVPFKESDSVDNPISLYAASKKANELIAHSYSHLYNLKTTGLRFFTVYGPWGRPDMAPYIFVKRIIEGKPITVFNDGNMERDFTYVDDIVKGLLSVVINKNSNDCNYKVYNIGNSSPVNLNDFIQTIEKVVGLNAQIIYQNMRDGDVIRTYADTSLLSNDYDYHPKDSIETGIEKFVNWYKDHHEIN
jgi:UDP-glucuronate 4-epimerase